MKEKAFLFQKYARHAWTKLLIAQVYDVSNTISNQSINGYTIITIVIFTLNQYLTVVVQHMRK